MSNSSESPDLSPSSIRRPEKRKIRDENNNNNPPAKNSDDDQPMNSQAASNSHSQGEKKRKRIGDDFSTQGSDEEIVNSGDNARSIGSSIEPENMLATLRTVDPVLEQTQIDKKQKAKEKRRARIAKFEKEEVKAPSFTMVLRGQKKKDGDNEIDSPSSSTSRKD